MCPGSLRFLGLHCRHPLLTKLSEIILSKRSCRASSISFICRTWLVRIEASARLCCIRAISGRLRTPCSKSQVAASLDCSLKAIIFQMRRQPSCHQLSALQRAAFAYPLACFSRAAGTVLPITAGAVVRGELDGEASAVHCAACSEAAQRGPDATAVACSQVRCVVPSGEDSSSIMSDIHI